MKPENEPADLSALMGATPVPTVEEARALLLSKVMAHQQLLSEQFSKIDHPFATDDAKEDHELARDEFQALIRCSIHMPESVEGVRFLEGWHANRMGQIELLLTHAKAGNQLVIGEGAAPTAVSDDFARGMRAALTIVRALFQEFPLSVVTTQIEEEEPDPL